MGGRLGAEMLGMEGGDAAPVGGLRIRDLAGLNAADRGLRDACRRADLALAYAICRQFVDQLLGGLHRNAPRSVGAYFIRFRIEVNLFRIDACRNLCRYVFSRA